MYSFKNDYLEIAHVSILERLLSVSDVQLGSYGSDKFSAKAKELIAKTFGLADTSGIHFFTGGTQVNHVFLNCAMRAIEAVIAPDSGHIVVNECGAIESNGNKIITVPNKDGKLTAAQVSETINKYKDEHVVVPRVVFISQTTEKGTVYSKSELSALYDVCKKLGLYLFIDGARLGCSLMVDSLASANENILTPKDIAKYCDAFYIGGTKNGGIGEALCIVNDGLKRNFKNYMKQHGALMAKSALVGLSFSVLFCDGDSGKSKLKADLENILFFKLAKHMNTQAQRISKAFLDKGYILNSNSPTNQVFVILPDSKVKELSKHFDFHIWDSGGADIPKGHSLARFVCGFNSCETQVTKLIDML
ncbi:MAG: aminotransferase class I/II-fold pyridoxal phosphate-dependent enzyme [Firmicutes bacterium]|nr:aminotransferase class I/II-fold pyridoxal phosphate-dependent enzyme [Bacillota bacterium]